MTVFTLFRRRTPPLIAAVFALAAMRTQAAEMETLHTAAGRLSCKAHLCATTRVPGEARPSGDSYDGPDVSAHAVRLTPKGRAVALNCTEGSSGDPTCTIDGRDISGELFEVRGDGCMRVFQTSNSYFPVSKTYCAAPGGKLRRVHQPLYRVGITATAHQAIALFTRSDLGLRAGEIPKGARYSIVAAVVDESDDFYTSGTAYLVRSPAGKLRWASQESLDQGQCGAGTKPGICFQGD